MTTANWMIFREPGRFIKIFGNRALSFVWGGCVITARRTSFFNSAISGRLEENRFTTAGRHCFAASVLGRMTLTDAF